MVSGVILINDGGDHSSIAWSPVGREALIQRQIRVMRKCCEEILLVTNHPKPFLRTFGSTVRIISRFYEADGPLSGLHAGLSLAVHPLVWVVNGNMPAISDQAATLLIRRYIPDRYDAVLPVVEGELRPLYGIYATGTRTKAETLLEGGVTELDEFLRFLRIRCVWERTFVEHDLDTGFAAEIMRAKGDDAR